MTANILPQNWFIGDMSNEDLLFKRALLYGITKVRTVTVEGLPLSMLLILLGFHLKSFQNLRHRLHYSIVLDP
jgi:hypothetical protein